MSDRSTPLRRVDEDQFRVLDGGDLDDAGILDGGAVARVDPGAVHLDGAAGRHQIAVTLRAERIVDRLAGLERGTEYARVSAYWQRIGVLIEAARERHQAPRAVA